MSLADLYNGFVARANRPPLMRGNYKKGVRPVRDRAVQIRRDPLCGLCGVLFRLSEPCFALLGDKDGMVFFENTLPFPYNGCFEEYNFTIGGLPGPSSHYQAGWVYARYPPSDSVMLHTECFELFRRHYNHPHALDRLFRFAAWRKPWPKIPNLFLPEARTVPPLDAIEIMAKVYGLEQLSKIPIEIMFAIWNYSPDALLWRYALVIDIAQQLNTLEEQPPQEVALADILSWDKYGDLVTSPASDPGAQTLVRLDSRGIRNVERIATGSKLKYWQSQSQRYLVIRSSGPDAKAIIMDGLMRLQVDPTHPDLLIGDTPNIHDFPLPRNSLSTQNEVLTENFGTIDLQRATGLTLFFAKGYKLVHIHGHTRERPLAEPPRDILTETQLHELKWVYVSFPRWKYALSISRAYSSSSVASSESSPSGSSSIFATRFQRSLSILGLRFLEVDDKIRPALARSPNILVFKKRFWHPRDFSADGVYLVGPLHFLEPDANDLAERLRQQSLVDLITHEAPGVHTYISMHNLVSTTVFTRPNDDFCRGILFRYQDGSVRTIGQCRLGYDDSVTVTDPLAVQISNLQRRRSVRHCQNGEPFHKTENGTRVVFHRTYTGGVAIAELQTLGNKWLRVTEPQWEDLRLCLVDEDQIPTPGQG